MRGRERGWGAGVWMKRGCLPAYHSVFPCVYRTIYIQPGQTYIYMLTSPTDIGQVHDVTFRWMHDSHMLDIGSWNLLGLRHPRLFIDNVQVVSGEHHRS